MFYASKEFLRVNRTVTFFFEKGLAFYRQGHVILNILQEFNRPGWNRLNGSVNSSHYYKGLLWGGGY